ncbi:Ig-like domain-containing protein [Cytobacillus massiliigabonensis]|uniref:Ig-like domain-containing protein n=1 Tax=Cytobacillus massiliigabonensis TaxID=1871011 RepID=UPI001F2709C0|nr:Ig-like domain-containing protein [Cytobacillus massiliigabonensis]
MQNTFYQSCRFLLVALFFLIGFNGISQKASAEEVTLPFNQETNGELTKDITSNSYYIKLDEAGRVTFDLTSYVDNLTYFKLFDDHNNKVFGDDVYGSSKSPAKYTNWVDLEAGSYRLDIYDGWGGQEGNYKIKTSFTSAKNNEIEPNNGTVEAMPLPFDKAITGFLSWNDDMDVYKITVPKAGRFTVDLSSYVDNLTYIKLLDDNNDKVFGDNFKGSSKNPAKYVNSVDLEPGTYYLEIYDGWGGQSGKYLVKTSIAYANNHDSEPNNGSVEAQTLPFFQTKTGFLSWNDTTDVYKITVPKNGEIFINLTSYVDSSTYIQLLDIENDSVFSDNIHGSSKNPAKYHQPVTLTKGTYYLKIYDGWGGQTGKYLLNVKAPYLLAPLSVDLIGDNAKAVTGKTAVNQEVIVKISGKEYKKKANSKGIFSITIPKQKAGTKIEISAKNGYGTQIVTKTVVDKTPPAAPTVNNVTKSSKTVTGKTEAGATVHVYKGSKKIGSAKVAANGIYKISIKPQAKGTILKIYAQDSSGNKSSTKQVKVQ